MLYEGYEFKKQKIRIKQEILDEKRELNEQYQEAQNNNDTIANINVPTSIPNIEEQKKINQKQSDQFDEVMNDGELIHMKRKKNSASGLSKRQRKLIGVKSNASPSPKSKQQTQFDDDELSQINDQFGRTKLQSSEKKPAF